MSRGKKGQGKPVTPEMIAAPGTEHAHQAGFIVWQRMAKRVPGWELLDLLFAVPNGGERNPIVAGRMKAEGARKGVWDICWAVNWHGVPGLWIEMKDPKYRNHAHGGLTEEQVDFGKAYFALGWRMAVCYTWQEARDAVLAHYGANADPCPTQQTELPL